MPALRFLQFDLSDADDGHATLDAMASVRPDQLPALHAEVVRVLAWAHAEWPDGPGALDDGASWDVDLQASTERSSRQRLHYDPERRALQADEPGREVLRHTLTLSIAASAAFAQAFVDAFGVAADD
ncbi:MAG: hypothetical protein AB9M60_07540 [Leptothrix sp. (in: b-proteobacteria)]